MRTELKVYATCIGVKKRCRSQDRHRFTIGNFPLDTNIEQLKELAKATLLKNMRLIQAAPMLHCDYVEIEEEEEDAGFKVETWRPFDERHKRIALDEVKL